MTIDPDKIRKVLLKGPCTGPIPKSKQSPLLILSGIALATVAVLDKVVLNKKKNA